MGGSGGGAFGDRTPEKMQKLVRKAEEQSSMAAFETELSEFLGDLLGTYNARDKELARTRLDDIKAFLETTMKGAIDQFFAGSVAKHTYVDGMSDVDSIIILDGTNLENKKPRQILSQLTQHLTRKVGDGAEVTHGRMAVTIEYRDGMVMQLLPALSAKKNNILVPSSRRNDWSEINPVGFQQALTRRNTECGGKLVPTIKLAKAVIGQLPESQRLSGYHVESLAIAAFRKYSGTKTSASMLPAFFESASKLVLTPIRDSSGQSVHVDSYLGAENSDKRQMASHLLSRLARRMRNATAAGSREQWETIFNLDQ